MAACNGSLLVCALESGFRIVRYRMLPGPHLENIDSGRREKLSDVNASYGGSKPRFRVTMYIINDTRAG
ncbi:humD [Salmonella enterica subsp. enterica serovar Typhi]|nr:humD [Salmonella enterica subsp. enterica serovar Typhi]HAD4769687.1 humD [Salmonella enterica subsp. enterica serovar Typhi str. CT18]